MQINENFLNSNLQSSFYSLDLLSKAENSLQEYFQDWKNRNTEEFIEYMGKEVTLPIPKSQIELLSYGLEVVAIQEDLLRFKTVLNLNSSNGDFICNYYAFFDLEGKLMDCFVDK